ncbi:hypothetical protein VPH35_016875 [Triticum aestivum]|uniref:uncharacterized protein n=1 Tax=Triticum aestivum TaxID=4565 RepID=UPI001D005BCB|nr:uncharacterized protein LOC123175743 [Triticum aestivum]
MHGTVRVNRNKLMRVAGEAAAAEFSGVAYARASSKPSNASAASCPGGRGWRGRPQLQGRLRVCRAGPPGRREQLPPLSSEILWHGTYSLTSHRTRSVNLLLLVCIKVQIFYLNFNSLVMFSLHKAILQKLLKKYLYVHHGTITRIYAQNIYMYTMESMGCKYMYMCSN